MHKTIIYHSAHLFKSCKNALNKMLFNIILFLAIFVFVKLFASLL